MGGSQKSKRVTWASDVNLCQVRLFLSEESPSEVGMGTQDHLQAKALWSFPSGGDGPDDNLPPGFEGIQPANLWRVKLSQIPLMNWRCPPRFVVNSEWQVVAGEESKETEAQNQREMRVLEAIYPRLSAIPPNPSALEDMEDAIANDQNTPLVPVTPIEDDDAGLDAPFGSLTADHNPMISQPPQHLPNGTFSSQCSPNINPHANGISAPVVEPDIVAAAQAALTSLMSNSSNSDQGNLIDRGLLIRILSNPRMVEQLVTSHGSSSSAQNGPSAIVPLQKNTPSSTQNMPSTSTQFVPNLKLPPKNLFVPTSVAINRVEPLSAQITRPELNAPSMATPPGPFYPPQLRTGSIPSPWPSVVDVSSSPSPSFGAPMTKDVNYYKSLIQQHGGEKRDVLQQFAHQSNQAMGTSQEPLNFAKSRESRSRIMKPCIYFNTSRGCRNGANCTYQHGTSSQQRVNGITEVQSAKRVKLDTEITGA